MKRFINRLARGWREENGVASVEFLFALPVLMLIFTASFETGMVMTRSIMLEQSLDMVMRDLRLGHLVAPDNDLLKEEICEKTVIFKDCENSLMLELQRVSTATFAMPTADAACVDREEEIQPVVVLQIGQDNDLMLVRACIVQDVMFATSHLGLKGLRDNPNGDYGIVAVSAFSNEPS